MGLPGRWHAASARALANMAESPTRPMGLPPILKEYCKLSISTQAIPEPRQQQCSLSEACLSFAGSQGMSKILRCPGGHRTWESWASLPTNPQEWWSGWYISNPAFSYWPQLGSPGLQGVRWHEQPSPHLNRWIQMESGHITRTMY